MKGSLIIVAFFALGCVCGVFHLIPFGITQTNISYYALCALMFSVGLSIGNDPQTLKNFRSLNPRLIFLPVMTILGGHDYFGNLIGSRSHQPIVSTPKRRRLHGCRSRFRLLLIIKHFHHRI